MEGPERSLVALSLVRTFESQVVTSGEAAVVLQIVAMNGPHPAPAACAPIPFEDFVR